MNGCFYVRGLEQLVLVRVRRGSRSRGQVELVEDVAQVPFDGPSLMKAEAICRLVLPAATSRST
jgi:hypothetical protein